MVIYNTEAVYVNLRRLRAFVTVAEELHFTRAAARLFLAQQSLSKQISDLESEIGTPLFERTSRKVELTAAGEAFLISTRDALALFDQGVERARSAGRGEHATLRVGFIVGAALELTTHILSEFTARFPAARVELHEFGLADPSAGLISGETDVAFIRLPCRQQGLVTQTLFTEPCVVGVSAAHRLSRRERVRVGDLLGEPIAIGRTDDPVWRDFWTLGGRSTRVVETNSQSEEMEVVAAGMACSITPAAARRYLPYPGVRFIDIDDYPPSAIGIARLERSGESTLVTGFVEAAVAVRDRERGLVRALESGTGAEPAPGGLT